MRMADLGVAALQELQSRRNRDEEVAYSHRATFGRSGCSNFRDLPARGAHLRPLRSAAMAAEQRNLGHGGHTCQGLTAKAERTNMFQVIDSGYLAGSMPRECQLGFICRDARAIIGDADKLEATLRQIEAKL